ncbi:hypothetical protein [Parapedobacter sp. DT-150]|uniref:hypothetical protein n=1 Tax=Parapedobacter sp. DT-150 TaxID=3396162 RepID=UPI003F1A8FCD
MNNDIPKRNKWNRHPARSTAWSASRTKGNPRQRIRQVLRASIPLAEVEKMDLKDRPEQL